ncbi:MAG: hypothetical protein LBQ59_00360 [Candidatus Peribacteria bacterium]|nr:hypothetical protein [Candidatus Peribacteria bacterium]
MKKNEKVFENKIFNKDVYDISISDYYSRNDLVFVLKEDATIIAEANNLASQD